MIGILCGVLFASFDPVSKGVSRVLVLAGVLAVLPLFSFVVAAAAVVVWEEVTRPEGGHFHYSGGISPSGVVPHLTESSSRRLHHQIVPSNVIPAMIRTMTNTWVSSLSCFAFEQKEIRSISHLDCCCCP